jgi:hypothetical protein
MPKFRLILEADARVQDALQRAGACRFDLLHPLPPFFTDQSPRPVDEAGRTARRPVAEYTFAAIAGAEPRVAVARRRRVGARGRYTDDGIPRRRRAPRPAASCARRRRRHGPAIAGPTGSLPWARRPYEQADCGYTRYFTGAPPPRISGVRSRDDHDPDHPRRQRDVVGYRGHRRRRRPLKALRQPDAWSRLFRLSAAGPQLDGGRSPTFWR